MEITREVFKVAVEEVAKEKSESVLDVITMLQGHYALLGDGASLDMLCDIKNDYIPEMKQEEI